MNRDATINHLILQGYVLYADRYGWLAIWNGKNGRLVKRFEDGLDGPGWDVRPIYSDLAFTNCHEVPWHRADDEALQQFVRPGLPPRYRHDPKLISADPAHRR